MNEIQNEKISFTIPTGGWYVVTSEFVCFEPTGRMIWVKNDKRRWFEFWKPKMIQIQERKPVTKDIQFDTLKLVEGDTIGFKP